MEKLLILPSWLLMKAIQPFLSEDHPLHEQKIPLGWWAKGASQLNMALSFSFWCGIVSWILFFIKIYA